MPDPVSGILGGSQVAGSLLSGSSNRSASRAQQISPELLELVGEIRGSNDSIADAVGQSADLQIQAARDALEASLGGNGAAQGILRNFFNQSNNELRRGADNALGFQQPLIDAGDAGLGVLNNLADQVSNGRFDPGEFNFEFDPNDEGFQFLVDRGNSAVNAGANAGGLLNSGGRLKELATFNQGVANSFKTDELNRQASVFDRNATRLNNQFTQANTIGSVLSGLGVGARNNASDITGSLSQQLASNLNSFGSASASGARSAANSRASLFNRIAALQGGSLVDQARIRNEGLLGEINARSNLEQIQRGIAADNNARNQQNIGNTLGTIGSIAGAFI